MKKYLFIVLLKGVTMKITEDFLFIVKTLCFGINNNSTDPHTF